MLKRKMINDPVYGFVTIRHAFVLELINHRYFQRLRRITQLGLSSLVYPGAGHNRFQHAMGAMHLMQNAIDELRLKGHAISHEEEVGLLCAILLHDIGHGPFSHALESSIVNEVHHEHISSFAMQRLNTEFNGKLNLTLEIFNGTYPRKFMHQLVSSQLDMDRLDYLARDSFFSGVVEGQVGSERLIKMLDVVNDQLVVEEKGIYSIEKFIVARRFMYWQVYLHKTVLSAEYMLVNVLRRAKHLADQGEQLWASPSLQYFLNNKISLSHFEASDEAFEMFMKLDDIDILGALKVWTSHSDFVLSQLATRIVERRLFKIEISRTEIPESSIQQAIEGIQNQYNISPEEARYFVLNGKVDNRAYNSMNEGILVKMKNGEIIDAAKASDHDNLSALSATVEKFFLARISSL
jgi:HD superfamily phosphohydrolase